METGSECDGWATLPQSERCAETRGSAAECRGKGETAECPQTTGAQRKGKKTTGYLSICSRSSFKSDGKVTIVSVLGINI